MEIMQGNTILIVLVAVIAALFIFFVFKKDVELCENEDEEDPFSVQYLSEKIRILFNDITNQNIAELYLNQIETKKREKNKAKLNQALRSCAQGNSGDKNYVKDYMKDLLQKHLGISEETIDNVIPFDQPDLLTDQDKFEILLNQYKKEYMDDALQHLSDKCGFEIEKRNELGAYYEVTKKDINLNFSKHVIPLNYIDKLEIVTQRIYQDTYGFSVIDEIIGMKVDGVSGGVSGITGEQYNYMEEILKSEDITKPMTYDSVWIILHGKPIHLSFLSFGRREELIRVCKNLYLYDNVGHLTSSNGYKLTYLQDGSRVVVVRPKLSAGWAFFVRKFSSAMRMPIGMLLKDEGSERVIELVKWLVKGQLNIIISGDQNSGKTTFLKAMMQYIDQRYPVRTTEQEFELWLNNLYNNINCVCFRGSEEVSILQAIALEKKTDGTIMLLGEVSDQELANAYISLTQNGTKSTMCTCHCKNPQALVDYFRNAALMYGGFSNEHVAEEQVADAINIDIHWEKSSDGHRYISYITEIIPLPRDDDYPDKFKDAFLEVLKRIARRRTFITRDIAMFEDGKYIIKNLPSDALIKKIMRSLDDEDKKEFSKFIA